MSNTQKINRTLFPFLPNSTEVNNNNKHCVGGGGHNIKVNKDNNKKNIDEFDEELQSNATESNDKMSTSYLYAKGARVWIKHSEEVWQIATVIKDYDKSGQLVVTAEVSGEVSFHLV